MKKEPVSLRALKKNAKLLIFKKNGTTVQMSVATRNKTSVVDKLTATLDLKVVIQHSRTIDVLVMLYISKLYLRFQINPFFRKYTSSEAFLRIGHFRYIKIKLDSEA